MNDLIDVKQKKDLYVHYRIQGCECAKAAKLAGFSEKHGFTLRNDDSVRAAISSGIWKLLQDDAPVSLNVLRALRDDPKVSASVRESCARTLLNRAGVVERKIKEVDDSPLKSLSELSGDELRKEVAKITDEIANRANSAKVIEHEPGASDDHVPDLFK